ncbi:unnamed protein product [Cuscuta campestris]|uniref:Uncharacterized protein n=1 Tax=Cuscuta campestris TaxID=132261 RepID=A0A484NA00_9ASTE|nr:unnamed protein product [Cuscuta campestris]
MLGRVRRPSISSLEQLEMERQPPKLIKTDSLSVYETTLLKLKEGSRRELCFCLEDSASENMIPHTENSSKGGEEASPLDGNSCSGGSTEDSPRQQQAARYFSLPFLFLRYGVSRGRVRSDDGDGMLSEDYSCSPENGSPFLGNPPNIMPPNATTLS